MTLRTPWVGKEKRGGVANGAALLAALTRANPYRPPVNSFPAQSVGNLGRSSLTAACYSGRLAAAAVFGAA